MQWELGSGTGMYRFAKKKGLFSSMAGAATRKGRTVTVLFFLVITVGAVLYACWINTSSIFVHETHKTDREPVSVPKPKPNPQRTQLKIKPEVESEPNPKPTPLPPFTCSLPGVNVTCPAIPRPASDLVPTHSDQLCPDHFRWIHEDLRPWEDTGITREMVERARRTANFRLVILDGRAYVEWYQKSYQTRDVFTIWGILQLLRRYPGRVPDLDLMFDCVDWPVIKASHYRNRDGGGKQPPSPPPLFRYCSDDESLDIVFPDWSFWGWAEINIKPWDLLSEEMKEGNKKTRWMDRVPYAYWKGNPSVAETRKDLLKCNVTEQQDWNARVFAQDWFSESRQGFKKSNLADQCTYRYKIYIEGSAWSVSEKYILGCDSPTLLVTPKYYDFFTRGLMPVRHYWPVRTEDKCRSIKFAVDWGNSHKSKAQAIGREASEFVHGNLKMDYVYDYMFHLLNGYAKLLRFKPTVPPGAVEFCAESMACPRKGPEREFMMKSMVNASLSSSPCGLPPPFSPAEKTLLFNRKANAIKQVQIWEQRAQEGH